MTQTFPTTDDLLWRHLKTVPAFRGLLRAVEARFYHAIDFPGPILDVGCGDGHFVEMAFDRTIDVGIDPWLPPLRHSAGSDRYKLVLQGMGDTLPFPDHSFGSAFSNSVLEHIPDVQPVLNDVGRVLQPNGRFVITMPSHRFTQNLGGGAFFAWRSWKLSDELMAAITTEANSLTAKLAFALLGGWGMFAHLGYAAGPQPLDLLTGFYVLSVLATFVTVGRRGMMRLG